MNEYETWDVIHTYSRAQAIEDGVLVDATQVAQEAGIKYPVALTQAVWADVVEPDPEDRAEGQSEQGRLWDVLWMLCCAIRGGAGGTELRFRLSVIQKGKPRLVELKGVCGPGDHAEPVITVMFPRED